MSKQFTFKKEERLCSKILLDKVFKEGIGIYAYPFRIVYCESDAAQSSPAQVVFSVPKRNFKLAVHRNLIRRRMRESYRLNKHLLYATLIEKDKHVTLSIIYTHKSILDYQSIEKGMIKGMQKIQKALI